MQIEKIRNMIPATIDDLQEYILIGREKLKAYQLKVQAIDRLNLAKDVRDRAVEDGQSMATALLYAEAKLGEMLNHTSRGGSMDGKRGSKKTLPSGITHKQSHYAQTLADHKEEIAEVIAEAVEDEALPTRAQVLQKVKEKAREERLEKKRNDNKKLMPENITIDLRHGDFRNLIKNIPDNSVDFIFTDPPYAKEFLPLWNDLARESFRILKPSKFFICYSGQSELPEKINMLSKHLNYYWLGMLYHRGSVAQRFEINMFNRAKPILYFYKPPLVKQDGWLDDVLISANPDKDAHEWGQNIEPIKKIIECFTKPNELILDPMFGGGSTIIAAAELKRNVIGFEVDEKYYEYGRKNFS